MKKAMGKQNNQHDEYEENIMSEGAGMGRLVISRSRGKKFTIGSDVEVTVEGIVGNQVKLSIVAPKSLPIWRNEVLSRQEALEHCHEAQRQKVRDCLSEIRGSKTSYQVASISLHGDSIPALVQDHSKSVLKLHHSTKKS